MAHLEMINGFPVIVDKWEEFDIECVAENMDLKLNKHQVRAVMDLVVHLKTHDCNIGITWDLIGSAIDTILEKKRISDV
jgi:hypothetical protein